MDWLTGIIQSWNITWTKILWVAGLFVVTFAASLIAVGFILVKLPARYFCRDCPREMWIDQHPVLRWTAIIGKNLAGIVLLVFGVIQLVTPGQGILTILIAIMLLDFPGKRRFERWLVSRPKVLRAINWLRRRYHKPPLVLEEVPTGGAIEPSADGQPVDRKEACKPSNRPE